MYLSPEEIADDFRERYLSPKDVELIGRTPRENMIMFHHSVGKFIRNDYGLWANDNPYTVIDPEPNADGVIDHPQFPDQVSMDILNMIWEKVNNGEIYNSRD